MDDQRETRPEPHPAFAGWKAEDGILLVNGTPVDQLARRLGRTPFYAYDRARITERIAALRAALPEGVGLHYAIKANPMPAVVQHLAPLVDGCDVASADELDLALDAGYAPGVIGFAGPGKTDDELARAAAAGILIEVESEGEARRLAALGGSAPARRPRIALRINPDFRLKGSGMHMGGGASQFGIDAEEAPALMRAIAGMGLDFEGFHIFGGSQNLDASAIATAEDLIADLAIRLAADAPQPVRHLNIGGGFGIPYFPKDQPFDLGAVGAALARTEAKIRAALPHARTIIELGRYIVGEAGVYVCRVIDRKVSRGQVYLVTDGGLHHHLAATGNFGQGIRRNYPLAIANRFGHEAEETASVVGCLCTPIDLLGDRVALPRAEVGDLVAIFQSGAYGPSASPSRFLGHPAAKEALL